MDWISYILGLVTLPIVIAGLAFVYALMELHSTAPGSARSDRSSSAVGVGSGVDSS